MPHFQHILKGVLSQSSGNPLLQFLVAGYNLDGNANDIRGLNNGTESSAITYVTGVRGQAANHNGDRYINTGFSRYDNVGLFASNTEEWSVCIWVYPTATTARNILAKCGNTLNLRTFQLFYDSNFRLVCRGSSINNLGVAAINNWHHIALTWDKTTLRYYNNGLFISNISVGAAAEENVNINIGSRTDTVGSSLFGYTEEAYIFKKALSLEEVNLAMLGL